MATINQPRKPGDDLITNCLYDMVLEVAVRKQHSPHTGFHNYKQPFRKEWFKISFKPVNPQI